jgi:hypothetical protein
MGHVSQAVVVVPAARSWSAVDEREGFVLRRVHHHRVAELDAAAPEPVRPSGRVVGSEHVDPFALGSRPRLIAVATRRLVEFAEETSQRGASFGPSGQCARPMSMAYRQRRRTSP